MKITDIKELENIAKKARKNVIEEVYGAKSGHPGSSLSCVDILTVLYFNEMNINPEEPKMENRDRLVLSKGHASPALYTILSQRGFFPEEELKEFRKLGSRLQGHPDVKKLPGLDMSSGSLGQGLSAACGMAIASKLKKQNNNWLFYKNRIKYRYRCDDGVGIPEQYIKRDSSRISKVEPRV